MNTVNVSLALSVSVSHPAICSCLGVEVCMYFIHGPKSLFALLPCELQWIVWKCRKKATWQHTKSTKAPLPLLFRAQLVPSFSPLLVCLIFPKPPFRKLLKIWRGPIVLQNSSREMSVCSKESKKTFSGFFYPEDLRGLLSVKCGSSKWVFKKMSCSTVGAA